MAAWNAGDVASAPGVSERKRAITDERPAPNSASSRSATAADSESASSQPPALRTPAVCEASVVEASARTIATMAMGRRKR